MAKSYMKATFTLTALTPLNLAAGLAAEGYTGGMIGKYLEIHPKALTDVFYGDNSDTTAATGIPIVAANPFVRDAGANNVAVDPSQFWLFSTGGGDISVHFEAM